MTPFDYRMPAELFPCKSDAGHLPAKGRGPSRHPPAMAGSPTRRTPSASQSRSFLPSLLPDACLEVNAELFDSDGIRRLYDNEDYPLVRRDSARWTYEPVRDSFQNIR